MIRHALRLGTRCEHLRRRILLEPRDEKTRVHHEVNARFLRRWRYLELKTSPKNSLIELPKD